MTSTLVGPALRPESGRRDLTRLLVGVAIFLICFDHGSYTTGQRTLIGTVVWWAIVLCSAVGILRFRPGALGSAVVLGLLALAFLEGASQWWSHDATSAFAEFERVLVYAGMAVAAIGLARMVGVSVIVDGIALGVSAVAALALASRCFQRIGAGRSPQSFLTLSGNRLSYPVDYWNGLAILVALALPLLLWRASAEGPVWRRAVALAVVPMIVGDIYLASSRGGAAVALVGVAVFVVATNSRWRLCASAAIAAGASFAGVALLTHWQVLVNGPLDSRTAHTEGHKAAVAFLVLCAAAGAAQYAVARLEPASPRPRRALGVAVAGLGVLLLVVATVVVNPVAQAREFTRPPHTTNASIQNHLLAANGSGRWQQWSAAITEWKSNPLLGGGAGSYYRWWLRRGSLALQVRNAHSLYAETLGEVGLVGFAALLIALMAGLAGGIRRLTQEGKQRHLVAAVLAAYLGFLLGAGIDWIWQLAAVGTVGIALLAMLAGVGGEGRRVWPAVVLSAGGALAAVAMLLGLLAESQLSSSSAAAADGRLAAAATAAADARRLEPWASPPRLQLALVQERRGDIVDAEKWIASATARDPGDWQLWLVDSRLQLQLGHGRAARRALRKAAALNPNSNLFYRLNPTPK